MIVKLYQTIFFLLHIFLSFSFCFSHPWFEQTMWTSNFVKYFLPSLPLFFLLSSLSLFILSLISLHFPPSRLLPSLPHLWIFFDSSFNLLVLQMSSSSSFTYLLLFFLFSCFWTYFQLFSSLSNFLKPCIIFLWQKTSESFLSFFFLPHFFWQI